MMAEKELNDASRGGWIMHRDGMRNASRGKKIFITMEKNQPRKAEKRLLRAEKL